MLLSIPGVLSKDAVAALRKEIDAAEWIDGNATSGQQSALAKRNLQLPKTLPPLARPAGSSTTRLSARLCSWPATPCR